jgi:prepilin-type N-terminal cleavage/methylation domain-containing protein
MKKITNQNGFTLIEALVAMVILTIGILSLYTMQVSAINGNATANRLTTASIAASDCHERLLNVLFDDATMDTTTNPHDASEFPGFVLPIGVTSIIWNVTNGNADGIDNDNDGTIDEGAESGIKSVVYSVNYNDKGTAKILTLNFYKDKLL